MQLSTSYGVFSYSAGLSHSRLTNWKYYAIKSVIIDDLELNTPKVNEDNLVLIYPNPTADYLNRVIVRVTWGGAFFLAAVAVAPLLSRWLVGGIEATTLMLISAAGLLIVVGVVLDTMRQIEAQLLMRQYEGFIR